MDPNAPIPVPGTPAPPPPPPSLSETDPQILNALIDVLERVDSIRPDVEACDENPTPFCEILKVGSPIGYLLRNRYLNPGVTIAEALARDPDEALKKRLVEMARWSRKSEVRTTALIGLANFHDPKDYEIFHEAVAHNEPAIRFGTLEALMVWSLGGKNSEELKKKAVPLLTVAEQKDIEPILRVFAAQALVRLDDGAGLIKLRGYLKDQTWLVRAMAARYLGDLGEGKDYDMFVRMLDVEQHQFVLAEYAIAALKLFPKSEGY